MKPLLYLSLYFILFILLTFQLPAQRMNVNVRPPSIECKIVEIDSVGNHYVIYARRVTEEGKSEKYKIVSEKDTTICQNIAIGQYYKLTLHLYNELQTMDILSPIVFPGGSVIIPYGWGNGLFLAWEIKGLCYNFEFADDIFLKIKERKEQEHLKFKNKRAEKKYNDKLIKELNERIGSTLYYEENPLLEWN